MRFDTIHIPAFGPFSNFTRDFEKNGHDIHLLYGANEAGKSSLLRGIHQMFYGIPVQSKDNFVHDNSKLRIGGTISNSSTQLSFLRKKGNKNTLLDTQGNTINDAELETFLGTVNGEFFNSMFGLDTKSLRDGADALLSGEGDLGTQLFSTSLGGTPIEAAITKLENEADSLYKGSGSKNKSILPALKAYKEGERLANSSATKVTAWNALIKDIKSAQSAFDSSDQSLSENRTRTVKLSNLTSALPTYSKFLQLSNELRENTAPEVSSDFIPRFRRTLAQQKDLSRSLQIQLQMIADQKQELASIPSSDEALQYRADVEALSNSFETYLANLEAVEHLQLEIELLESTLQLYSEQLELDSPDRISQLSTISESQHSEFKQLAQDFSKQELRRQLVEYELVEIEANIAQHQDELKCFEHSSDTTELEDLIQQCETHAAEFSQQEDREEQKQSLCRSKNILISQLRLDAFTTSEISIPAIAVPSEEAIQLQLQRENNLLEKLQLHQQKLEGYDEELANEQSQLDRLKDQAAIYSHADLTKARESRDDQLNQISLSAEKNLQPDSFTQLSTSINLADTIADTLHSNAEKIAKAETHLVKIESLTLKQKNSERYKREILDDLEKWTTDWHTRCESIPVNIQSPTDLLQWRQQWLDLCTTIEGIDILQRKIEKHSNLNLSLIAQIQTSLQSKDVNFRGLFSTLKSEFKAATRGQGKLEAAQTALTSAQLKRTSAIEKFDSAESALCETQSSWASLCASCGFPENLHPEQILDLIDKRGIAQQEAIKYNSRLVDIASKNEAINNFNSKACELTQLLFNESTEDVTLSVSKLKQYIDQAQQAHIKASTIQDSITAEQRKLPELELQSKDINAELQKFLKQAQVEDLDAMEPAILAIESKAKLSEALASQRDTLQSLADQNNQTNLDLFFAELDGLDRDQLRQELDTLTTEAKPLQQARDTSLKALDELRQQQHILEQASDTSAAHKQDAANALSLLVTDTERFIRLQYAISFLRDQVESFRKKSQGPMMEKTSHYFSALTSNRYSGVAAQLDDKGKPQLISLRRQGDSIQEIHTAGLSEGTADQLYLSLRLAAIDLHLDKHTPIPLILDDLLMTFDDERTRALLPVLAELSKKTQILIFTHHSHLSKLANDCSSAIQLHQLAI
ncbi:MAG: AAA family ATPase [Rubritalea sp.]|uniref:AAA family ATPase n=1 Tax=Rubritalea sp. TaxID=2109375 RepID=UPI0032427BB5